MRFRNGNGLDYIPRALGETIGLGPGTAKGEFKDRYWFGMSKERSDRLSLLKMSVNTPLTTEQFIAKINDFISDAA